jgi:DNA-3-methyladenine glycosylase II
MEVFINMNTIDLGNTSRFEAQTEAEQVDDLFPGLPQGCWEDNMQELKLFVPHEFCFSENLKYLANASNECLFHIKEQRIFKAISIKKETPIVEISADRDNVITIRFLGKTTPAEKWVRASVARYVYTAIILINGCAVSGLD